MIRASLPSIDAKVPGVETRRGKGEIKVLAVVKISKVVVDGGGNFSLSDVKIAVAASSLLHLKDNVVLSCSIDGVIVPGVAVAKTRVCGVENHRITLCCGCDIENE